VGPGRDGFPDFNVRLCNSQFLPRDSKRLVLPEALSEPGVGVDVQVIADPVHGIDVGSCRDGAAVSRIDGCEPLRQRRQR
jgi:hypothetical protein